ncbi:Molecular chaperones HSP105/HSP110/SSE1, HSP70 superfamily, partial [Pseudoloma neurophilia]
CTKDDCCSNNECTTKDCSDKTKNEKQNETQSDNIIEAIGGNSNNFLIKDFLSQMNIKTSCDPHETVSFGVTLAGALTATYNPYNRKVLDCLSDDIFIRNKEEKIKIFNKGDIFGKEVSFVQEGNKLLVIENYNQNKTEGDKRTEGDEKASSLEGSDKRTEGDEQALQNGKKSLENDIKPKVIPFNRSLVLEQNGFKIYEFKPDYPCSLIFLRNKSISIKGVTQQKNDNFLNLLKYENEMRKKELEIENIGKINNDLQTFLFQIEQFMNEPTFFSLFNEDEIKNISDLSIQLIDIPITNDLKIEEIKIQQFKCKIEPFIKKMEDSIQDKKNSILELIDHTYKKIKEIKTFTPSLFKLQSMLNGTRDRVKHLKYTDDLNILNNEKMAQEIAVLEIELEKEIKQLEDLEKKKKQETKDLKSEGDESGGKGSAKEGDQEKQETKKEGDESESDKEKQQGSKEKQET